MPRRGRRKKGKKEAQTPEKPSSSPAVKTPGSDINKQHTGQDIKYKNEGTDREESDCKDSDRERDRGRDRDRSDRDRDRKDRDRDRKDRDREMHKDGRLKKRGDSAFHHGALAGHSSVVRLLAERGANMENPSNSDRATPFLRACEGGNYDCVCTMVEELGANMYATDIFNQNGLHIALHFDNYEVAQYLIEQGLKRCDIPRCMRCKLKLKLMKRKLANAPRPTRKPMTDTEKKHAMEAFEAEFGSFADILAEMKSDQKLVSELQSVKDSKGEE